MKLIMAIIHDEDAFHVMDILNEKEFSVTKLASTGGFYVLGIQLLFVVLIIVRFKNLLI